MIGRIDSEASTPVRTENRRGAVVVISGPSGVGKSTICRELCTRLPAEFSVSVTTRPVRPGEVSGRDYHFVDRSEFERLRSDGALLETASVYGHDYGTPRAPVEKALAERRVIVLEIDIYGARQVRGAYPQAVTLFVLPPTPQEQHRRITDRRTNEPQEIARRLDQADGEIRFARECGCYDYFIINDRLEETIDRIATIVQEEIRQ